MSAVGGKVTQENNTLEANTVFSHQWVYSVNSVIMRSGNRLYQVVEGMNGIENIVEEVVNGVSIGGLMSKPHHLRLVLARLRAHKVDAFSPDFKGRTKPL